MTVRFLDTNIILRHLLQDHPEQSRASTELLRRVEARDLRVRISDLVVFEAVFTLQRSYGVPPGEIRDHLLPLIELPAVDLPGKRLLRSAFDLYVDLKLPFADAYHAALMTREHVTEIITFDRDFDRVPGATRLEPGDV